MESYFRPRMLRADNMALASRIDFAALQREHGGSALATPISIEGGRYVLTGVLGRGASAIVFDGWIHWAAGDAGTPAAFKVFIHENDLATEGVGFEWMEATFVAALSPFYPPGRVSPSQYVSGIAAAFYAKFDDRSGASVGRAVIVMELMDDSVSDMGDFIAAAAAPGPGVNEMRMFYYLTTCMSMVADVAHLHSRGVIHSDIKPGNFLVKWDMGDLKLPRVKISDLGLSCFGSKRFYELFRAHMSPGPGLVAHAASLQGIPLPRDYGVCPWLTTEFFESPTFHEMRTHDAARNPPELVQSLASLRRELMTQAMRASHADGVVQLARKWFLDAARGADLPIMLQNDAHCLVMAMVMTIVQLSVTDGIPLIVDHPRGQASPTGWLRRENYTMEARDLWRSSRVVFVAEANGGELGAALQRLSRTMLAILQESSTVTLFELSNDVAAAVDALMAESPAWVRAEMVERARTAATALQFTGLAPAKKRLRQ